MSKTYPYDYESTFPDEVDDIPRMLDLESDDIPLAKQYESLYLKGEIDAARQILEDNPGLENKLFNAYKFNWLRASIRTVQKLFEDRGFCGSGFKGRGFWSSNVQYSKGDCVFSGNIIWQAVYDNINSEPKEGNIDWLVVLRTISREEYEDIIKDITYLVDNKENNIKTANIKNPIIDADTIPLVDSQDSNKTKRITWSNIKNLIRSFLATTYSRAPADITATSVNTTIAEETTTHTHSLANNSVITAKLPNSTSSATGVTNAKLAYMANNTIKGNVSGTSASPSDLNATQVKTMLALNNITNESKATMFTTPTFTGSYVNLTCNRLYIGNYIGNGNTHGEKSINWRCVQTDELGNTNTIMKDIKIYGGELYANSTTHFGVYDLLNDHTAIVYRIANNGNGSKTLAVNTGITFSATGTVSSSDERLKHSFEPLDAYECIFDDLEPCSYIYKNGRSGRRWIGFKAQAVKKVLDKYSIPTENFAGIVIEKKSELDDDYNGLDEEFGIRYDQFISLNTHMIQKTRKHIRSLENRIEDLEHIVKELIKTK